MGPIIKAAPRQSWAQGMTIVGLTCRARWRVYGWSFIPLPGATKQHHRPAQPLDSERLVG